MRHTYDEPIEQLLFKHSATYTSNIWVGWLAVERQRAPSSAKNLRVDLWGPDAR